MLDEQFFSNAEFYDYLTETFIPIHAVRGEEAGDALYSEYSVRATPTVLIADENGTEIDRVIGYGPPAAKFKDRIEESYHGANTLLNLKMKLEKEPDNLGVMFQIAKKYQDNYMRAQAKEMFDKIFAREEEAKKVTVPYKEVSAFEYSKFLSGDLTEFIEDYPESELIDDAYKRLSRDMSYSRDTEKALGFYDKMLKMYPDDNDMLKYYLTFAVRNNMDTERALKVAEKISGDENKMQDFRYINNYAKLLAANNKDAVLDDIYGDSFANNKIRNAVYSLRDYAEFWVSRGENIEDALEKARIVLKLNPNTVSSVAGIFVDAGETEEALSIYGPDYVKENKNDWRSLYSYAYFWGNKKQNLKSALKAIDQALKHESQYYMYNVLATVQRNMGDLDKAYKSMETAIELAPRKIPSYENTLKEIKAELEKKD